MMVKDNKSENKPELYFDDESGKRYKEAFFDGYEFGDRLLEDVIFRAYIENNELKVEVAKACRDYFNTLNTKMWLEAALDFAKENDVFMEKPNDDDGKELVLQGLPRKPDNTPIEMVGKSNLGDIFGGKQ